MANNQYANKVIYGGDVIIDISTDDVTAAEVQFFFQKSIILGQKCNLPKFIKK